MSLFPLETSTRQSNVTDTNHVRLDDPMSTSEIRFMLNGQPRATRFTATQSDTRERHYNPELLSPRFVSELDIDTSDGGAAERHRRRRLQADGEQLHEEAARADSAATGESRGTPIRRRRARARTVEERERRQRVNTILEEHDRILELLGDDLQSGDQLALPYSLPTTPRRLVEAQSGEQLAMDTDSEVSASSDDDDTEHSSKLTESDEASDGGDVGESAREMEHRVEEHAANGDEQRADASLAESDGVSELILDGAARRGNDVQLIDGELEEVPHASAPPLTSADLRAAIAPKRTQPSASAEARSNVPMRASAPPQSPPRSRPNTRVASAKDGDNDTDRHAPMDVSALTGDDEQHDTDADDSLPALARTMQRSQQLGASLANQFLSQMAQMQSVAARSEREVAHQRELVAQEWQRIEERRQRLQRADSLVQERAQRIARRETTLRSSAHRLRDKAVELNELSAALRRREEKARRIEQRETDVKHREEQLERWEAELTRIGVAHKKQRVNMELREAAMARKEQTYNALNVEIQGTREELERTLERMSEREQRLHEREREVRERDERVRASAAELERLGAAVERRRAELEQQSSASARNQEMATELERRELDIEQLRRRQRGEAQRLEARERELQRRTDELAEAEALHEQNVLALDALVARLNDERTTAGSADHASFAASARVNGGGGADERARAAEAVYTDSPELHQRARRLDERERSLNAQRDEIARRAKEADERLSTADAKWALVRKARERLDVQRGELATERERLHAQHTQLETQLNAMQASLAAAERSVQEQQEELSAARSQLATREAAVRRAEEEAQSRGVDLQRREREAHALLKQAESRINSASAVRQRADRQLAAMAREHEERVAQLRVHEDERAALNEAQRQLKKEKRAVAKALLDAEQRRIELRHETAELQVERDRLRQLRDVVEAEREQLNARDAYLNERERAIELMARESRAAATPMRSRRTNANEEAAAHRFRAPPTPLDLTNDELESAFRRAQLRK